MNTKKDTYSDDKVEAVMYILNCMGMNCRLDMAELTMRVVDVCREKGDKMSVEDIKAIQKEIHDKYHAQDTEDVLKQVVSKIGKKFDA